MLIRMDLKRMHSYFHPPVRALIRKIFTQRRKQLGSLAKKEDQNNKKIVLSWLVVAEHPSSSRPEQIPPEEWKMLGELLALTVD